MLNIQVSTKFRKDVKRIKKRGYNLSLLQDILDKLCSKEPLAPKYRDHHLLVHIKALENAIFNQIGF